MITRRFSSLAVAGFLAFSLLPTMPAQAEQQQRLASATGSYPVPIDPARMTGGAGVGILVTVPAGVTATYTVQVSGDPRVVTPTNWNPHDTLGTPQTASANANLTIPCTWVQLVVTSYSGTAPVVMNVVQAGP